MTVPAVTTDQIPADQAEERPHSRWTFLRDVLVFQLKLLLGNLHNLVFVPISLIAAGADILFLSGRQGARFYKVMEWAREGDEAIGLYSALDENAEVQRSYSVDAVVARVEDIIIGEYAKGGTAATVKTAVDRALDRIQRETPAKLDPEDIIKRAAEKIREKVKRRTAAP
ncbi:MAG: hypothetical protein JO056_03365 [Alphaproteobacteria bacterium]|nr:hypothetical protein [Alphaproteobacteria bacterium]